MPFVEKQFRDVYMSYYVSDNLSSHFKICTHFHDNYILRISDAFATSHGENPRDKIWGTVKSHSTKNYFICFNANDEKCFLFYLKNFFCSQDIFAMNFRSSRKNGFIRKISLISKFVT